MSRNPDNNGTPHPSELQDDWLEGVDQEVTLVDEDTKLQRELKDLQKSVEMRMASLTPSQLERQQSKREAKMALLLKERTLRDKASHGQDEAGLTKVNEEILSLGVETQAISNLLAEQKRKETHMKQAGSISDEIIPTIEAGPDMSEDEEFVEEMVEKTRRIYENKLKEAEANLEAQKQEALAKALLEAEDPEVKADRANVERALEEARQGYELKYQKALQKSIDDESALPSTWQEDPAWKKPVTALGGAEVEFEVSKKMTPRSEEKRSDIYAVQNARVKSESFWARAKRTWFGGTTETVQRVESANKMIDQVIEDSIAINENKIKPIHDILSSGIISARRGDLSPVSLEKKPPLLGRLWNRVTGKVTEEERLRRSGPYAEASQKAEEAYRSMGRQPGTEYPSYNAKKEYGRTALDQAALRMGKKKIAGIEPLPDSAIEPLEDDTEKVA